MRGGTPSRPVARGPGGRPAAGRVAVDGLRRRGVGGLVALAVVALLAGMPARGQTQTQAQEVPVLPVAEVAPRLAQGGWVLLMRHAQTVAGTGDPPNFRIGDCATQRNLSDAGRAQARRTGEALRAAGVRIDRTLSSQWCRCEDTARLAFGAFESAPALNSFFDAPGQGTAQNEAVLRLLGALPAQGNVALVTHQVNITGLTGVYPASGELVAARLTMGRLVPAFRIAPASPG